MATPTSTISLSYQHTPSFITLDLNSDESARLLAYKPTSTAHLRIKNVVVHIIKIALIVIPILASIALFTSGLIPFGVALLSELTLLATVSFLQAPYKTQPISSIEILNKVNNPLGKEIDVEKIQRIAKAFAQERIPSLTSLFHDSQKNSVLVHPIDLGCGSIDTPHIFEADYLLERKNQKQEACPSCKISYNRSLKRSKEVSKKIEEAAHILFRSVENILQRIPMHIGIRQKNHQYSYQESHDYLQKELKNGMTLFEKTDSELVESMKKPEESLTNSEKYLMAFCIAHQFKPLQLFIDKTYHFSGEFLTELRKSEKLALERYATYSTQLNEWYIKNSLISNDYPILKKITSHI